MALKMHGTKLTTDTLDVEKHRVGRCSDGVEASL
jgi:hypothetical protein